MKKIIYSLMLLGLFGLSHSIKTEETDDSTENSREMQEQQAIEEAMMEAQIANSKSSSTESTHSETESTHSETESTHGATSGGGSFTFNDDNIQGQALDDDSTQGGMSNILDQLTIITQTISNDDAAVQALYNLIVVLQNIYGQIPSNATFVAAIGDLYNKLSAIDMTTANATQTTSNSNS